MKKNDMDIILSRIERLSVFIEGNTLEGFQREILRVENICGKGFSEHRRSCSVSASIQELCL